MAPPIRSVYVHAPFCARRCSYCDFAVTVDPDGDAGGWGEALAAELRQVEREGLFGPASLLTTLYVGGGTPSLLGPGAMDVLAGALGPGRLSAPDLEWTAEANPESFTPELAKRWRAAGVNRVSLGVQSFHEPTLQWMGRLHGAEGPARAVEAARDAGIANVSIDLIFGLPVALGRSWTEDLERALAFEVPHVSLYGLTVEPRTPLGRAVAEGREPPVDAERYREEFLLAAERLAAAGYEHYEVSNFARDGLLSRHNGAYWDGRPYLGLGNGAHSYRHPVRSWNVRDWEAYRARVLAGESAEEEREELTAEAAALERVWLGLRTREGLARASLGPRGLALAETWIGQRLADFLGDRVRLTPLGWLELDRLAVDLDAVGAGLRPQAG
ncbi:MAG: radical SAM family heme chaperone HemW [Gemmatimonadota bacterium]|nr:radical SAM family heme chaperone HemW [Gemmatimonadota bacterium]